MSETELFVLSLKWLLCLIFLVYELLMLCAVLFLNGWFGMKCIDLVEMGTPVVRFELVWSGSVLGSKYITLLVRLFTVFARDLDFESRVFSGLWLFLTNRGDLWAMF